MISVAVSNPAHSVVALPAAHGTGIAEIMVSTRGPMARRLAKVSSIFFKLAANICADMYNLLYLH